MKFLFILFIILSICRMELLSPHDFLEKPVRSEEDHDSFAPTDSVGARDGLDNRCPRQWLTPAISEQKDGSHLVSSSGASLLFSNVSSFRARRNTTKGISAGCDSLSSISSKNCHVAVCIAHFALDAPKPHRERYLLEVLAHVATWRVQAEVVVATQNRTLLAKNHRIVAQYLGMDGGPPEYLGGRGHEPRPSSPIRVVVPSPKSEEAYMIQKNPLLLPHTCRTWLFRKSEQPFDYFVYLEDDMVLTWPQFLAWDRDERLLSSVSKHAHRGFFRTECGDVKEGRSQEFIIDPAACTFSSSKASDKHRKSPAAHHQKNIDAGVVGEDHSRPTDTVAARPLHSDFERWPCKLSVRTSTPANTTLTSPANTTIERRFVGLRNAYHAMFVMARARFFRFRDAYLDKFLLCPWPERECVAAGDGFFWKAELLRTELSIFFSTGIS